MDNPKAFTITDPVNGNLAFKLFAFNDNSHFDHLQRNNYFSIIWIKQGGGKLKSDFSAYAFDAGNLLVFGPYQPFMLATDGPLSGLSLQFHPDFFCIHKHHKEVACNGVLFHNIYHPPFVKIDDDSAAMFNLLLKQIEAEMQQTGLAQYDALVSYLKLFLITAARLKTQQMHKQQEMEAQSKEPYILQNLKDAIEANFRQKHSAGDYADQLNISAKALARITKAHFNKTITDLIAERIIIEAKRELYLTNKQVKEIAWELGYEDEFYFSRFFKTHTDVSPQGFRNTVGFNVGATMS
jgi:AraC family transcriptional activator of pobA